MSEHKIEQALEKAKIKLTLWFSTSTGTEQGDALNHAKWALEKVEKNEFIRARRADQVQRRRSRVYWTDLGMNVGSELNGPHFCVVIKEFQAPQKVSVIVPLSSVKESDPEKNWKTEENGFYEIGCIEDLPNEKRDTYAVVSQIRSVSKKRLSNFQDPVTKEYVDLRLNDAQMDIIDKAISKHFSK